MAATQARAVEIPQTAHGTHAALSRHRVPRSGLRRRGTQKLSSQEYSAAMGDWSEFAEATKTVYGVDMSVLEKDFEREQKECYLLSLKWAELPPDSILAEPAVVKVLDMATCTIADSKGISAGAPYSEFDFRTASLIFDVSSNDVPGKTISGFAGWFTVDFASRTDDVRAVSAPKIINPAFLSTGPEMGVHPLGSAGVTLLVSPIPLIKGEKTRDRRLPRNDTLQGQCEVVQLSIPVHEFSTTGTTRRRTDGC